MLYNRVLYNMLYNGFVLYNMLYSIDMLYSMMLYNRGVINYVI